MPDYKICFRNFKTAKDFEGMIEVRKQCIAVDKVDTHSYLEHFLTAREMAETITLNCCDPTKDVLIVENNGVIVGYCQICWWTENDCTRLYLHVGYLVPEYRGKGIGTMMLDWCEKRIREIAQKHPTQGKSMFGGNASSTETDKIQLLTDHAYKPVFTQVELVFTDFSLLKDLRLINGFEIRQVKPEQIRAIWETINEVYAERATVTAPTEEDYQEFVSDPNNNLSLWQVAWSCDEIAALVLAEIKNERAEITEVATRTKFRRRGLAQALLTKSLLELQVRGIQEVRLHTDGGNISGARSLYEKIGFNHLKDYIRYRKPIY
jgi:mycothiol synthase